VKKRRGGSQLIPRPEQWHLGEMPSWASSPHHFAIDHIEACVSRHVPAEQPPIVGINDEWLSTARASAVLVPLVETSDGVCVVLTRRSDDLRNHRGEISFPGGRVEESESIVEAALREAHEEISLAPDNVRIIGQLDPHATFVSNSLIVPMVGIVQGTPTFKAQASEVTRILVVPLDDLADEMSYHNEWWVSARGTLNIHFFLLDDETIWGATGRILRQLLDVVCVNQGPA
jgi:8-oxo-dGTP pyrophosphatase MutT (NUDIX family)